MKSSLLSLLKKMEVIIDILFIPFLLIPAVIFYTFRRLSFDLKFPLSTSLLYKLKVYPIIDHYYEPLFNMSDLHDLRSPRDLPGINFNVTEQLELLKELNYSDEVLSVVSNHTFNPEKPKYIPNNNNYRVADAVIYYSMIRKFQPKRIIEIGSGFSTLIALAAKEHIDNDSLDTMSITCVEPYEYQWLKNTNITLIKQRLEELDIAIFQDLAENDILFIDSSHIIRPQGDVLTEVLEILPSLQKGVIVHIHDIFSPRNYLDRWLLTQHRFWNEQYLIEAFLSNNSSYKILLSSNYLKNDFYESIESIFPKNIREEFSKSQPGSLWIQKVD